MKLVLFAGIAICLGLLQAQVRVITLDNQTFQGDIVKLEKTTTSSALCLRVGQEEKKISCSDIVEVICQNPAKSAPEQVCILLHNNSLIYGKIITGNDTSIALQSATLGMMSLEIGKIREIRFIPDLADAKGDTENDILYFRTGDTMKCVIEQFGKDYVQVQHPSLGIRKEPFDKLERIVLAQVEKLTPPDSRLATVLLGIDGSRLVGSLVDIQNNAVTLELASWQQPLTILLNHILRFFFINGRFIYISDIPPSQYQVTYVKYFDGGSAEAFLPKYDKNWVGGILRLNGQTFYKGIGVISRTEIKLSLQGKYRKFQSQIGLDDTVAENLLRENDWSGIGGSVVFQIWADGVKKFDSGIMRASTPSKNIDIDVAEVSQLLLVVDWADNDSPAFAKDFANWAGARLVK